MSLTAKQRAAIIFMLNRSQMDDFEAGALAPDLPKMATRTGISSETLDQIWTDTAAFEAYRLDPNDTKLEQFARMPDLEAEVLGNIDNARPFFSLSELEAATGAASEDIRSVFSEPTFELPGASFADQALVPALDVGFVLTADTLPPKEMFEALGFRVEQRSGRPMRVVLYQDAGYDAAALNSAKALAGGRLLPAMRDSQGFARFYIPGWLDVWFVAGTSRAVAETILSRHTLLLSSWQDSAGIAEVRLAFSPANRDALGATLAAARNLRLLDQVELAEPKQFAHDNEPDFDEVPQDFLSFGAGDPHWHRAMIRLDEAHLDTQGSDNVTIFVIDSGIDMDHPDLVGALRDDWADHDLDFGCGPDVTVPNARGVDHGTGVASLALGRAPTPTTGVMGVAPNVRLVPMRIEGRNCDYINRAIAIRSAISLAPQNGRAVINLSWQTEGSHEGVYLAIRKASEAGIAIVTSAGNYRSFDQREANKPHYPSGYGFAAPLVANGQPLFETIPGLCSVGAVSSAGVRSSYSFYGNEAVTLAAPGGESGGPGHSLWIAMANTAYGFGQGTSFSAPLVAGSLALLFSKDGQMSAAAAINLLKETAKPLDTGAMLGAGVLDVKAALDKVIDTSATDVPDKPAPDDVLPPSNQTDPDPQQNTTNMNLANANEIARVPMLGPFTAGRIVAHRGAAGPFQTSEDFQSWLGTDDWAWSVLSPHITV
jgi:subtilisin family serine protease